MEPPADLLIPEDLRRPPIAQAPISVVLLATGPPSQTAESVAAWKPYLDTLERPYELIALESAAERPDTDASFDPARRIAYDAARGLGVALQEGFAAAQHPLVVLSTADGQFQPPDLQRFLAVIDHVDIAVGCRMVRPWPLWLRLLGRALALLGRVALGLTPHPSQVTPGATPWRRRWVAAWLFGVRLHDPECTFRLFRREAVTRIVLQSQGRFALVEQLAKANHLEMIMTEEPLAWSPPPAPPPETIPFAQEARTLFRRPEFGHVELHVKRPEPPQEKPVAEPTKPPLEKPDAEPTKLPPPSS